MAQPHRTGTRQTLKGESFAASACTQAAKRRKFERFARVGCVVGHRQAFQYAIPKCSRTEVVLLLEGVTEVSRIVKAPVEGNFGDAFGVQPRVAEIGAAPIQTLGTNPIGDGGALIRKDTMHMADRNSQSGSDLNRAQGGFREVGFDVIGYPGGKFQHAVRAGLRRLIPADAGSQNSQVAFHDRDAFRGAEAFRLFEEGTGEMEQNGAKTGVPGNSLGKREFTDAELALDKALRHPEVQASAISRAVRRPGERGVDESCIAFPENGDTSILAVAAQALELGDDDASPVFRAHVRGRIFVEGECAGREEGHFQVSQFAAGDRAVKRKFSGKLEVAVATDLLGVPQPSFLPLWSGNLVGCK